MARRSRHQRSGVGAAAAAPSTAEPSLGDEPLAPSPVAINERSAPPFLISQRRMWVNRTARTLRDFKLGDSTCRVWFIGDVKPVLDAFADDARAAGLTPVE